jgi:hypothetical protein
MRYAVVAGLLASVTACDRDKVPITQASAEVQAYGRAELVAAVQRYSAGAPTPARYREMIVAIDAIRGEFDEHVAQESERFEVFLAVEPMNAQWDQPLDAQRDALATTVWPTAMKADPKPNEAPAAYVERLCADELALDCGYVVSEYRSLVVSALVWERLASRAADALVVCKACQEPRWREQLATFKDRARESGARAKVREDEAESTYWPVAGDAAGPWPESLVAPDAPRVVVGATGGDTFAGAPIPAGGWVETLRAGRGDARVLGVTIKASAKVSELRTIARDAGAAGYAEVALMAYARQYPFAPRAYRLAAGPAGKRGADGKPTAVRVRDVDRVQVLVQALDAAAARGAALLTF